MERRKLLFDRRALELSPADAPFWYTSGTFGPYYINTHYLMGGEAEAKRTLKLLDDPSVENLLAFHQEVQKKLREDEDYCQLMTELAKDYHDYAVISGGARRDFYFSFAIAEILGKPHLALLKEGRSYWMNKGGCVEIPSDQVIEGPVLHVADLLTAGSSYIRAWIPMLEEHGLELKDTLIMVDRAQEGTKVLREAGVTIHAPMILDEAFFVEAKEECYLSEEQLKRILEFRDDPTKYMENFLHDYPDFLEKALAGDSKSRERAQRYLDLHR